MNDYLKRYIDSIKGVVKIDAWAHHVYYPLGAGSTHTDKTLSQIKNIIGAVTMPYSIPINHVLAITDAHMDYQDTPGANIYLWRETGEGIAENTILMIPLREKAVYSFQSPIILEGGTIIHTRFIAQAIGNASVHGRYSGFLIRLRD